MHHKAAFRFLFPVALSFLLPGCLVSTQSFNHGKLLNPGERLFSIGAGWKKSTRYFKKYDEVLDTTTYQQVNILDTNSHAYNWLNIAIDHRSGVLRHYPFGRGLEIGYHIEGAFKYYTVERKIEILSPPLLEIETRLGLPDRTLSRCIFHHNVSLGWITGQYVDNGWFLGYAAGWEFRRFIPFASVRIMMTATDKMNQPDIDEKHFFSRHDRTFVSRISTGATLQFPTNYSIIPEYITPELSILFPNYSFAQHVGISCGIGIRWLLGQ